MIKRYYCKNCGYVNNTKIVHDKPIFYMNGRRFTFDQKSRVCGNCDSFIFDIDIEDENFIEAKTNPTFIDEEIPF